MNKEKLETYSYTPKEVSEMSGLRWPYTDIYTRIEGLEHQAQNKVKSISSVNIKYLGIKDKKINDSVVKCHIARITAFLVKGET